MFPLVPLLIVVDPTMRDAAAEIEHVPPSAQTTPLTVVLAATWPMTLPLACRT
jgi:hypothetical protein